MVRELFYQIHQRDYLDSLSTRSYSSSDFSLFVLMKFPCSVDMHFGECIRLFLDSVSKEKIPREVGSPFPGQLCLTLYHIFPSAHADFIQHSSDR